MTKPQGNKTHIQGTIITTRERGNKSIRSNHTHNHGNIEWRTKITNKDGNKTHIKSSNQSSYHHHEPRIYHHRIRKHKRINAGRIDSIALTRTLAARSRKLRDKKHPEIHSSDPIIITIIMNYAHKPKRKNMQDASNSKGGIYFQGCRNHKNKR